MLVSSCFSGKCVLCGYSSFQPATGIEFNVLSFRVTLNIHGLGSLFIWNIQCSVWLRCQRTLRTHITGISFAHSKLPGSQLNFSYKAQKSKLLKKLMLQESIKPNFESCYMQSPTWEPSLIPASLTKCWNCKTFQNWLFSFPLRFTHANVRASSSLQTN